MLGTKSHSQGPWPLPPRGSPEHGASRDEVYATDRLFASGSAGGREVRATSRGLTHGEVPHGPVARAGSRCFPLTGIRSVAFTRAK